MSGFFNIPRSAAGDARQSLVVDSTLSSDVNGWYVWQSTTPPQILSPGFGMVVGTLQTTIELNDNNGATVFIDVDQATPSHVREFILIPSGPIGYSGADLYMTFFMYSAQANSLILSCAAGFGQSGAIGESGGANLNLGLTFDLTQALTIRIGAVEQINLSGIVTAEGFYL